MGGRPIVSDAQQSFAGGLNHVSSEFHIPPTQYRIGQNVIPTQYGDVARRLGTRQWSPGAGWGFPIQGGFCWRRAADHEYLVAVNNQVYSVGPYTYPMSAGALVGALGASTVPTWFEPFRDGSGERLYVADGVQLRKYTPGGALAAIASTPALAVLAVYNQRLFGVTGTDQNIHYSAINNGDSCGVTGADSGLAVVRTFSNQKLTALLTLKGSLALFHVSGVSRWEGLTQDDISISAGVRGISSDTGTIAPRSAIAVDGIGYFLSERGAYRITDAGVEPLDRPNSPDPLVRVLSELDDTEFVDICAVHDKTGRTIRWFIPGYGVYVYSYRLDAWAGPWTGAYLGDGDSGIVTGPTSAMWSGVDDDGRSIMMQGTDDSGGVIRILDWPGSYLDDTTGDDDGSGQPYQMIVQCRRFLTTAPLSEKAWRFAWLFVDTRGSTEAAVAWSTATGSGTYTLPNLGASGIWGTGVWGTFSWSKTASVKPFRVPLCHRGAYLDLTYSDGGATGASLSRIDVEAFDYGRRG
jgi:hypothetical protein